jgi:hypothetical protein
LKTNYNQLETLNFWVNQLQNSEKSNNNNNNNNNIIYLFTANTKNNITTGKGLFPLVIIIIIIIIIIITITIIYLFTAIGLLPGGSGYFTCKQNMKLVTTKFKSGGLPDKHVVATWNVGNRLSVCL